MIVEGAIDPDTTEPTTARFTNCVFTRACGPINIETFVHAGPLSIDSSYVLPTTDNSALQGGALFVAATKPIRARAELQGWVRVCCARQIVGARTAVGECCVELSNTFFFFFFF